MQIPTAQKKNIKNKSLLFSNDLATVTSLKTSTLYHFQTVLKTSQRLQRRLKAERECGKRRSKTTEEDRAKGDEWTACLSTRGATVEVAMGAVHFLILERAEWGVLGFCFIPGALRLASVFRLRTVATISTQDKEINFDNNRQMG